MRGAPSARHTSYPVCVFVHFIPFRCPGESTDTPREFACNLGSDGQRRNREHVSLCFVVSFPHPFVISRRFTSLRFISCHCPGVSTDTPREYVCNLGPDRRRGKGEDAPVYSVISTSHPHVSPCHFISFLRPGVSTDTPREYVCNLGPDGRRRDADERPELMFGSVEFVAPKEYSVSAKPPNRHLPVQ